MCIDCEPLCEAKECGDDGCGGLCGECEEGLECTDEFICEPPCEPDCEGRECGDDGCGASCGECEADNAWCGDDGICILDAVPADTIDQPDVSSAEDLGAQDTDGMAVEAEDTSKKKKDGCSHSGAGNPASLVLLLVLIAILRFGVYPGSERVRP